MAEEPEVSGRRDSTGAVGGEDVIDDPILNYALVIFRGYVMECLNTEDPAKQISLEDLGGRPHEQDDQSVKHVVEVLVNITREIRRNAELQRLVNQVEANYAENIFMTVARSIFSDGINLGRIAGLYHLAYKLSYRAITTNHRENICLVQSWLLRVFKDRDLGLHSWIIRQGGWAAVIRVLSWWRTVAIVVSMALVASLVYFRNTR